MRRGMSASLLVALIASSAALVAQGADPISRERRRNDDPISGGKKTAGQMEARMRAAEEKRLRKNAKRLNQGRRP